MYVYITGRGHSGSTILDVLLGNSAEIESVGEFVSGAGRYGHEPCSCGRPMHGCGFWRSVTEGLERRGVAWRDLAAGSVRQAHVARQPETWLSGLFGRFSRRSEELARGTKALAEAIADASGKPHALDSGKEPTRALHLLRHHLDARVIHLVRDPRAIAQSHYWRLRKGWHFRFLRRDYRCRLPAQAAAFLALSAASWTVGNLLIEAAIKVRPGNVLRVRYEDLRDAPEAELRRIGAWLGVDVGDVVERLRRGENFAIGHNVGGNQIRLEGPVRFHAAKERTRAVPPAWVNRLTVALSWPLLGRYGYPLALRPEARPQPASVPARVPAKARVEGFVGGGAAARGAYR